MKSRQIPLNQQHARAISGIDIYHVSQEDPAIYEIAEHRDDYYILAIATSGESILRCDMVDLTLKTGSILLIRPFQVHAIARTDMKSSGWMFTIAPFLMPAHCAVLFQQLSIPEQSIELSAAAHKSLTDTAALLQQAFLEENPQQKYIMKGLFDALINRVAALLHTSARHEPQSQAQVLAAQFKNLLADQTVWRTPAYFAEKLHVTTAHLNDCVKTTSGFPLTYWLQHTLILEAKRQLYYTDKSTQQIAYDLGFSDPAYFSRLFRKVATETPLAFRRKFRE